MLSCYGGQREIGEILGQASQPVRLALRMYGVSYDLLGVAVAVFGLPGSRVCFLWIEVVVIVIDVWFGSVAKGYAQIVGYSCLRLP